MNLANKAQEQKVGGATYVSKKWNACQTILRESSYVMSSTT
jgi:hypothetical protein